MTGPVTRAARAALVIPGLFIAVFFLVPVVTMFAVHLRMDALIEILGDDSMLGVLWYSTWLASVSTALTLVVGMPATWAVSRHRFRGSSVAHGLLTAAFLMPASVVATGVLASLPAGHNRGLIPILWAHLVFNVAVVVRLVGPRWALVDPQLERAAAGLGASPLRVFSSVVWPELRANVCAAAALVWVFCFGSFAVVSILGEYGTRTIETEIFTQAVRLGDTRTAVALSCVQLVVTALALWAGARARSPRGTPRSTGQVRSARTLARRRWLPPVVGLAATTAVVAPLFAVAVRSMRADGRWTLAGYRALFDGTLASVGLDGTRVMATSALFAVATVALGVPCALLIALADRGQPFPRRSRRIVRLLDVLSSLPLVVSSVTLGLGVVLAFDTDPFAWRGQSWLIPAIHTVLAVPLLVRIVGPALNAVPPSLHAAAATLGASPLRSFLDVDLRTIAPALLRGAGVAAAVSLGEFGATSLLSRSGTTTVPLAIAQLLGRPGALLQQAAFALATVMVLSTAGVLSRA